MDHWSNIFPIIFLPLKIIVLAIGGYFAVKWHFDEEKRVRAKEKAALEKEKQQQTEQQSDDK